MVIYRVFTAVAKFIATEVRKLGILAIFYIDDILTLGKDTEECEKAVGRLLNILKARGFVINYKKSDLSPTKIFTYLGHVWNTDTMMVSLKPQREVKIRDTASSILNKKKVCGWKAAQFIGQVMSSLMAIPLARANIRKLQWRFIKTCPTYKEFNRSFLISEDIQNCGGGDPEIFERRVKVLESFHDLRVHQPSLPPDLHPFQVMITRS